MRHSGTGPKIRHGRGKAQASLDLIQAAYDWLETAHPTSVRGVCYHLFTVGIIESMEKRHTAKVSRLLTAAREDNTIPWEWIVDETRNLERVAAWGGLADYAETLRHSYRRDFWADQPHDVEVWSEKGTVRGVLGPVLDQYGVGFRVMHGFAGATTVHDIATGVESGRRLYALYVGDWDPSGLYMSEHDLPERLARYGGHHVELTRIALREGDVAELPFFDAETKSQDGRYQWFTETYGDRCWEIDAMDPNTLRARVTETIEYFIADRAAWERCEAVQRAEQESVQATCDTLAALEGRA